MSQINSNISLDGPRMIETPVNVTETLVQDQPDFIDVWFNLPVIS